MIIYFLISVHSNLPLIELFNISSKSDDNAVALDTDDDKRSKILNQVMKTKLATLLSSLKAKNADSVFLDYDSKMFRLFFAVSRKKQSCNEQNDLVHDEERKYSQK
jgi:hypothetical protein